MSRGRDSSRPPVSVVMPFAGTAVQAQAALGTLAALRLAADDELILADNCGAALGLSQPTASPPVRVLDARGERSPAHARNAGAAAVAAADADWILFLDADTVAPPDLLERFFAVPIDADVGAVAGGITAAPLAPSAGIVARYGAHKNFLDAGAHLAHPFMPRAAAANLLVRRAAFDAVGGFFEGLRAAEDTDFSWRLQLAGWTLAGRPVAVVEHRYRDSLYDLRRQWRGYAAGRAWLARRYDGFAPQPALLRAAGRVMGRAASGVPTRAASGVTTPAAPPPRLPDAHLGDHDRQVNARPQSEPVPGRDRLRFAALDAVLGVDELVGFSLSNRPPAPRAERQEARRVLVADRFPGASVVPTPRTGQASDQTRLYGLFDRSLGELTARGGAERDPLRIEADRRADRPAQPWPDVTIVYREDDGPLDRARGLATLAARRPGRLLAAFARRRDGPSPAALAPAACRLLADSTATLSPASTDPRVRAAARQLGRLVGRELS